MHFEVVFVPLHDRWPPYEVRATPMVVFQSNQVKSFRFHPQSVLNLHTKSLKIAWAVPFGRGLYYDPCVF